MNIQLDLFSTIPISGPYEYTDISPIACWLQTTKTGWSPGKAIAQNGRNYYRVLWGNGQQSSVPKTSLKWKEPNA